VKEAPVFFDPSGRRRLAVNRLSLFLGIGAGVVGAAFVVSLLVVPFVPQLPTTGAQRLMRPGSALLAPLRVRRSRHLARRSRNELLREIAVEEHRRAAVRPDTAAPRAISAAFYVIWRQDAGLQSLRANAGRLTDVMPEWLHLDSTGTGLDLHDWDPVVTPKNLELLRIARQHGVDVLPVFNNAAGGVFDPQRAHAMLATPGNRAALIDQIGAFLDANRLDGVNVDLEALLPGDRDRLVDFVDELQQAVGSRGKTITVDIEAGLPTAEALALAEAADWVVVMAYAQHAPTNAPGPLAATGWYDSLLARMAPVAARGKLVAGIGAYALDWDRGTPRPAASLTFERVLMTARDARPGEAPDSVVDFDERALNPTFVYRDTTGERHEVWFLDAVTARNQMALAARRGARGTALWVLGAEDPGLWRLVNRTPQVLPPPAALDTVPYPYGVEYDGDGEILTIGAEPRLGLRTTDEDTASGLITDETYTQYPSAFVIHRAGYKPGLLALTFDDGPDGTWTSEILDVLDSLHVPGTFFLVGRNVERWPGVTRRIWDEGHEIGNHTFTHPNMATVSRRRAALELNATQRALESALGRSTTLFRVPYNADAEPSNAAEAMPLQVATALGYVTVGEQLDPQDWNLYRETATGEEETRGTADIVESILRQARTVRGNVLLLHSAGGDRSRTVDALRIVVPLLQQDGFRFVRVSDLLGTSREATMPPVPPHDQLVVGADRITFTIADAVERLTAIGFLVALVLAFARVAFVVVLALLARRARRRQVFDPAYRPSVAVLIAAYNEAPVIAATVRSVLASDLAGLDVVVVDDGSTDGTATAVRAAFPDEPRVRVMSQANAGKAAALNRALEGTEAEIVVCFDADTQVEPEAIGDLVRHFADPRVAAVAGNVKVGNRINTVTIWQSIEYVTSQNLDRQAYAHINAVTVVPGAIGAWRRSAMLAAGGYTSDTLAEDMDLTWRLRRAGWRILNEPDARAWTEAPETVRAFLRQRRRWTFGSMQVLWKHRGVIGHYGWFGWVVVPTVWLFTVLFQFLGPLVDLRMLYALVAVGWSALGAAALQADWQPFPQLMHMAAETGFFYAVFFLVDLVASAIAFRLDDEPPRDLWWLFWQRFVYRQTLYVALWQSMTSAVKGKRRGWGKMERTGKAVLQT